MSLVEHGGAGWKTHAFSNALVEHGLSEAFFRSPIAESGKVSFSGCSMKVCQLFSRWPGINPGSQWFGKAIAKSGPALLLGMEESRDIRLKIALLYLV
jgi:hypothetical protein